MKQAFKILSLVLILGFTTQVRAGVLVEPYFTYETGSALKLESSAGDDGGKSSGLNLGLRAAYRLPVMVWLGLDYSMMSGGTFKGVSSVNDGKIDRSNLYFDVGVNLPVLVRVWAGYGLMNIAKIKSDSGGDLTLKSGTNFKLGLGFTALPLVSINFEYFIHDYKNYESGSASGSTSDLWTNHKETSAAIGVSVPFNL